MFRKWLEGSLSLVQLHVLTVLETAGPLPMGKLADALDVSVASATGIVDRMEQRGLVERRHDEADRRIVLVHSTESGRAVFNDLAEMRRAGLDQHPRPAHERRAEGAARRPPGDVEGSGSPAGRGPGRIRFEPRNGRAQRPAPPGSRGGDDMIGLLPDLSPALHPDDRARPRPAARRRDRQPVPARPPGRHHQQRRRQGRHRLHPPRRRADAARHRGRRRDVDHRASTSARGSRWASAATSAARSSRRSSRSARSRSTRSGPRR